MRHRKTGRKLGMDSSHRRAMFRNMTTSLIENERIVTTEARAKEARRHVERLITLARKAGQVADVAGESAGDRKAREVAHQVSSRRRAAAYLRGRGAVKKLFDEIGPRFADRPGGYTRIIKWKRRDGDNALLTVLELIPDENQAAAQTELGDADAEA